MGRIVATKPDYMQTGFGLTPEVLFILCKNHGYDQTTMYYLYDDPEGGQYFSVEPNDQPGFVSKYYFGDKADFNTVIPHKFWLDVSKKCRWTKHFKKDWFIKSVTEHPEMFPGYEIIELPDKVRSTKGIEKDRKLKARQKQRREEKKLMEAEKLFMKTLRKQLAAEQQTKEENQNAE